MHLCCTEEAVRVCQIKESVSKYYHKTCINVSGLREEVFYIRMRIGCPNGVHCVGTIFCLGGGGLVMIAF